MTDTFSITELIELLSPSGQRMLITWIHHAKEKHGDGWRNEIRETFPFASWIVELVATKTADDAYNEFAKAYPSWPVWMIKRQLIEVHGLLLKEINKPRF